MIRKYIPANPYVTVGDRVRLVYMADDPHPIPPRSEGVVTQIALVQQQLQVSVKWDNGRTLGLIDPIDRYEKI